MMQKIAKHAASSFQTGNNHLDWEQPNVEKWKNKTFNGYHRADVKMRAQDLGNEAKS